MFDLDLQKYPNLPKGPKIFVVNHPSTTDPFIVGSIAPDKPKILIHGTLFKVPVFGKLLKLIGHIPVNENKAEVIKSAIKKLTKGESLCIFVEGGISPLEGGFLPPRTGAARLAVGQCVPVIPIGVSLDRQKIKLINTTVDKKVETGAWYVRGPYAATFGRPLYFVGDVNNRDYIKQVTGHIMDSIAQLSAQSRYRLSQKHNYNLASLV